MATITQLEELEVWRLAREYAQETREILRMDNFRYEFGMKEQMKNASGSIMDNIAEGFGRGSRKEFINHLTIAKGSAEESRSQVYRCIDDALIDENAGQLLLRKQEMIVKKIGSLIRYLNQVEVKGQKFKDRL
jgi:four helix bundle protein